MFVSLYSTSGTIISTFIPDTTPARQELIVPELPDFRSFINMPDSSRPVPVGATDDVWHQHEAQIKDLYQNKRKKLQDVKRLMEEKGFPETP